MHKLLGAALTITAAAGLGFYYSSRITVRIHTLQELNRLFLMLRGEIEYSGQPLPVAFSILAKRLSEPCREFCRGIESALSGAEGIPFNEIWENQVETVFEHSALLPGDIQELVRLGNSFGFSDRQMQCRQINLYLEALHLTLSESEKKSVSQKKLYQSMGVAAGVFLTILFI